MPHFRKFPDFRKFPKRGKLFFSSFFFFNNMTISTNTQLNTEIMCRNMWKYPLKYAPEHTIPHWKTKKLHTVGGGTPHPPPLGHFAPSQEVFRKFGMLPVASLNYKHNKRISDNKELEWGEWLGFLVRSRVKIKFRIRVGAMFNISTCTFLYMYVWLEQLWQEQVLYIWPKKTSGDGWVGNTMDCSFISLEHFILTHQTDHKHWYLQETLKNLYFFSIVFFASAPKVPEALCFRVVRPDFFVYAITQVLLDGISSNLVRRSSWMWQLTD